MEKEEIWVAFTTPASETDKFWALGNIWRITAKKTDFYLDPLGEDSAFHLSMHGPNDQHNDGHRFHVKADRKAVAGARARGEFVLHSLPRKGYPIDGEELAPGVFRVARIRWRWDLQRDRFRQAAINPGPWPEVSNGTSARKLSWELDPNEAADVDLVVSYNKPHWLGGERSLRDNARLGPLRNDAGMWLTATSYRRPQTQYPTPEGLAPRLPASDEDPSRILGCGPDRGSAGNMYWFVEAITSRQLIDASRQAAGV